MSNLGRRSSSLDNSKTRRNSLLDDSKIRRISLLDDSLIRLEGPLCSHVELVFGSIRFITTDHIQFT